MEFILNPYSVALLVSGTLVALLSAFIAIRLGDSTRWIALTMLAVAIWGFFYGLELSSTTKERMLFYINFEYLGILTTPPFWMLFCMYYTGFRPRNKKLLFTLIFAIPIISYILVLTNDFHQLHYAATSVSNSGPFPVLEITIGPWYLVNVVYSYLTFVIGMVILWRRFRFADPLYKTQTRLIFVAGLIPILFNIFYQSGLIRPYANIDLTPYAFLLTYLIIAFAILKFNLFSIKPVALGKVMEALTKGVLVVDAKKIIVDFNPALLRFFKNPDKVKTGGFALELFSSHPPIQKLLKEGEKKLIEFSAEFGEEKRFYRVESIPLLEKGSSLSGTILLFENITEEINTKETLQKQKEELQQLNDLKDKYFSIISHDLKGPIFGVKELIHLTQSGLVTQEEFMEMMPEISKNMENVAILMENLLAWTSSQLRGEYIQLHSFDVCKVLVQQKNLLERIAIEKGIRIEMVELEEIFVYADRNMIELVVRNLINNAIKFSDINSTIKLTAHYEANQVKICVKDSGVGISEENLLKLNQGISFTTKGQSNESGTGLGLILVREYVQKNNGKLEIQSELGKGTKFCIYLPKSEDESSVKA
ncbi:sensor histidine kinase [Algoriphagus pacificus]|uniref:histidine kinase n=1 Tax=Algoriphagus pacificus TaxID=2811234 RepID=A0ABS3CHY9_9BACT|nr:histidine kinase N-terminal 7TM domain-containing protein [Algoriphagus pacificus]MBN7815776.1 GHKL domain-containing protein [Algoriphagus pacificus]